MKKKKIIIFSSIPIILSLCFITFKIFAESEDPYEIYKDRVNRICLQYKPTNSVYQTKNYEKLENKTSISFNDIKDIYKENMNNLYKCMILNAQEGSYKLIKDELIKNNPKLNETIGKEIDSKLNKLKLTSSKTKCNSFDSNNSINKLDYLTQTTYELCKYHSYLEYLKNYNSDYNNLLRNNTNEEISINLLNKLEQEKNNEIDEELKHVYKVFPLAFNAYKQYEDNLSTHLLLELIKKDYIALRENLHNSLNPINQVVYKIANAMKK